MLQIHCFGSFSVRLDDQMVVSPGEGMGKTWNVLKYMLTNHERPMPGEVIAETFWPKTTWAKARHSLYNTIYKLRRVLGDPGLFVLRDGLCSLRLDERCSVDALAFNRLYTQALQQSRDAPNSALESYQKAVSLYRGDYLMENYYDDWVKGAQSRYRNQYRRAVLEYSALLLVRQEYGEIRDVCEKALELDPLDEDIQFQRVQALIEDGHTKEAKTVYEQFARLLEEESGAVPSKQMQDVYQDLQMEYGSLAPADLDTIQVVLDERAEIDGVLFCDPEFFQQLYVLERRRASKTGSSAYLAKIDLVRADLSVPTRKELERAASALHDVLKGQLGSLDMVCRWNDSQFLLLLPMLTLPEMRATAQCITNEFQASYRGLLRCRVRERALK